jgi:hypothetical protein
MQPPGYPREPPISIPELHSLAHQKPQKPSNPQYNQELMRKLNAQLWYYGISDGWDDDDTPLPSVKKIVKDSIKAGKVDERSMIP